MESENSQNEEALVFTDEQRLQLQQLRLLQWMCESEGRGGPAQPSEAKSETEEIPEEWELLGGIELYDWQEECVQKFFEAGKRGTIKVVTGAGKTILALAITQELQNEELPELRVAIVVPTIVLMNQWYDELIDRSNLPAASIGRLGGGYKDDLSGKKRILIAVLPSASEVLPKIARAVDGGKRLLLILDECHRAGAPQMSRVLRTERCYSLGLSATPEREDDEDGIIDYDASALGKQVGPIIYEMTYQEAIKRGIIPPFRLFHYGLALSSSERQKYEKLGRSISDLKKELMERSPAIRKAGLARIAELARRIANGSSEIAPVAAKYVALTGRRKRLLYQIRARIDAVTALLSNQVEGVEFGPRSRAILFHEVIDEVMRIYSHLRSLGLPVVAEHSQLPDELRSESLKLYRKGIARIIVSAKSLIEGFNVPEADLGIVVASSTSTRQRIQSMGRVLRKHKSDAGGTSTICVLYARDTVDEQIYGKVDWNRITGASANNYYEWDPPEIPKELPGPPIPPRLPEIEIDLTRLQVGDEWPGDYEGEEYTVDSSGNVLNEDRRVARNPQGVPDLVYEHKGGYGRFRVTPLKHALLVLVRSEEDWLTLYIGVLKEPFHFEKAKPVKPMGAPKPGDPYPRGKDDNATELSYSKKRGGVIARKVARGKEYALPLGKARNRDSGQACDSLRLAIRDLSSSGKFKPINKIYVNDNNDIVFYEAGKCYFITRLKAPLEWPSSGKNV